MASGANLLAGLSMGSAYAPGNIDLKANDAPSAAATTFGDLLSPLLESDRRLSPCAAATFEIAGRSDGAVSISIANVSVPAGTEALVGVYASSNSGDVISGFNLPLDVNDDGLATLPNGFAYNGSGFVNPVYANFGLDTPMPQISLINVDSIPIGSGGNITLSSTPTLLFDLAFNVAGSVPVGTVVPIEIEVPASPFSPLFNVAGPNSPTVAAPVLSTPVKGLITVTGVPEPTAAIPLTGAALAVLGRPRRKIARPFQGSVTPATSS